MHVRDSCKIGWQRGLTALRSQFLAGAMLWGLAFTVLILYHFVPRFAKGLNDLGEFKNHWGYYFDLVSVGSSAGVVPSSLMSVRRFCGFMGPAPPLSLLREFLFIASHSIMFSLYGVWIDILFQLQNYFFGAGEDLNTIAHKVAMDQGFFCPLFDVPVIQMSFLYIDCSLGYASYSFCSQF